ncbi:EAL domain-containing protein [Enterobacteriaceae bacterium ESL0689]|nr:EAL domain-containing protein [Enterobacteriaceae bacterium ESL0689]
MKFYQQYRDKWWALPLILPTLLLPLANQVNAYATLNGNEVALYCLPLALVLSLMLFFNWVALPGLIIGLIVTFTYDLPIVESVGLVCQFLIPSVLCWAGYHIFSPRRRQAPHGNIDLIPHRLLWLMLLPSAIFVVFSQLTGKLQLPVLAAELVGSDPFNLRSLITFQALMVGCLTGVPLCYFFIRIIRNPLYFRRFIYQARLQVDPKVNRAEFILWSLLLVILLLLLFIPLNSSSTIFSTSYTLSLLTPVMLWGGMRFGYRLIAVIWIPVLILIIHFHDRYLPVSLNYQNQLAVTSSSYLLSSFIVVYMAMLATRQRLIHSRIQRMAFLDPVVHMPNIRALSRALDNSVWSVICFLCIPELELLGRYYGVLLRIQYKQKLAEHLGELLQPNEDVYDLSGHDLVIRLNSGDHLTRIAELDQRVRHFRFIWDGIPLQPRVGISYCNVRSPVQHLHLLLGELNNVADMSLTSDQPENMSFSGVTQGQYCLKDKVARMHQIQQALEQNQFYLMAQPIMGIRGDNYHEVLLRMVDDNGKLVSPADFLPVAHEFGLVSQIDIWVLEHTLSFMDQHRKTLPGLRLAVNLSPVSVSRSHFPDEVSRLLAQYHIEPWQLIFELTENHALRNPQQARQTLAHLQMLGCRVAIDDFGTGYASYVSLKNLNADLLKIDGSFIRNLMTSSLDYQVVASICNLARMKKMQLVAEYVETPDIRKAVLALGIDYLQGYDIGEPVPLASLVTEAEHHLHHNAG